MKAHLFFNGPIITMSMDEETPESVLVAGDRISFVGALSDSIQFAMENGLDPEKHDLEGETLAPGFIDAHMHPIPMLFFASSADLENATSLDDVGERLKKQITKLDDSEWLIGVQFENKKLSSGEKLTRTELDEIVPERPCLIYARDGHCVIVNSAAISAADIANSVQDPEGGHVGRTNSGELDGFFHEKAVNIPLSKMAFPSVNRLFSTAEPLFKKLAENGVTSIGAMVQSDEEGPGGASASIESAFLSLLREKIPQSIYTIVIGKTLDGIKALSGSPLNDQSSATKTRAFKIFADGTFGSCTACMSEPYSDKPATHGYMILSPDDIFHRMEAAHLADYQICIHAIGDRGIKNCVDMYEKLLSKHPKEDHRHRIEHASIGSKDLIERIASLGLLVCSQPLFIRSEKDWLHTRLGEERSAMTYPFRNYVDAGILLAGSSDAPIESTDVIAALDYAVNRGGFHPEQGLTPSEALAMYTKNAAFLQFEENDKGTLEVGKQADMIVLSQNPLTISPEKIGSIRIKHTMIRGDFINRTTSNQES